MPDVFGIYCVTLVRKTHGLYLDFDVLKREGIIEQIFPLHDASFGERVTRNTFTKSWLFPWLAPNAKHVGGPYVSHPSSGDNVLCPWNLRAWAQPFSDIREYFGEAVALAFLLSCEGKSDD